MTHISGFVANFRIFSLKNKPVSLKHAILIYVLLFFSCTSPFWVSGDVVSPFSQCIEFGYATPCRDSARIENRGFTDHPDFYVPEVYQQLNGARSGWLALWTNQNELGRPLTVGFSLAYLPSWIIAKFTSNPWRFITVYSLLTCFFAGLFVMSFCREMNLHPLAGLMAGSTLALSPPLMLLLIFPQFLTVWCWAAGALWGITRIHKRPDLLGWSILAFSVHSLGVLAYPQLVVQHGYILLGCWIYFGSQRYRKLGKTGLTSFFWWTASASLVGVVATAPELLDLAFNASESNQSLKHVSFFTMYLQGMNYLIDVIRFFVFITLPEFFGNFADQSYKLPFYGFSITLLSMFLLLIGLFLDFKRTIGWWISIICFVVLTFSYSLYDFGVRHLGFNLSPVFPIDNIILPIAVITGFGTDKLLADANIRFRFVAVIIALIGAVAVVALAVVYGLLHDLKIRWGIVTCMLVVLGLLATQIERPRPVSIFVALAIVTATSAFPVMFRQSSTSILTSSPMVESIRSALAHGGRYAIAKSGLPILPPNLNASLGLESVHNSNSMASRRYQTWLGAMNEGTQWMGGRNSSLSPDYDGAMFWMSNISLILSPKKLTDRNLLYVKKEGAIYFYKVISRMGESLQITAPYKMNGADINMGDVRSLEKSYPVKLINKGDLLEFNVAKGEPSVFLLSQKYHKDWKAQVEIGPNWRPAKTVVINGVFQGVLLPADTHLLRLEFKPYIRFAWIAQVFWVILLILIGFKAWENRRSHDGELSNQ